MIGTGDQARLGEFLQAVVVRRTRLLRIECDDFEIVFFAEGEESVAGAASGMDAAECGTDAGVFFDEIDAAIEIAAT